MTCVSFKELGEQHHGYNEFESRRKIIKDQSKVWWSLITDSDPNKVEEADIKFLESMTILQLKYGYDRQVAQDEVSRHVAEDETKLQTIIATRHNSLTWAELINHPREDLMNKDAFEGKWKQIRGEAKAW